MKPTKNNLVRLVYWVTSEQKKELEKGAKKQKISGSAFLRKILEEYFT